MTDRFQDIYRKSNRLSFHDYSSAGGYFITMNTKDREPFLADINENYLRLTCFGMIVYEIWKGLPLRYPEIRLDSIAILPDHVHALFWIDDESNAEVKAVHEPPLPESSSPDMLFREEIFPGQITARLARQQERRNMTVPKLIGYWKMNSAKRINLLRDSVGNSVWQRNYFDEIIQDEKHLIAVRKYIEINKSLKI